MEGEVGGTGRSEGRGNRNQDILCDKRILNIFKST